MLCRVVVLPRRPRAHHYHHHTATPSHTYPHDSHPYLLASTLEIGHKGKTKRKHITAAAIAWHTHPASHSQTTTRLMPAHTDTHTYTSHLTVLPALHLRGTYDSEGGTNKCEPFHQQLYN